MNVSSSTWRTPSGKAETYVKLWQVPSGTEYLWIDTWDPFGRMDPVDALIDATKIQLARLAEFRRQGWSPAHPDHKGRPPAF